MARKAKADPGAGEAGSGITLTRHPKARRQIAMAKGWGGLLAFAVVVHLSSKAGLPTVNAVLRGLLGGLAGYVVAWVIAVNVWRHLALAELEALRRRVVESMEAQAQAAAAATGAVVKHDGSRSSGDPVAQG
ncbi:hypothetical protein FSW04_04185 [Baekduia soli]|uniref:Uncharacterized protein n=1 Tax=Baekduia soli TaxID=496014 RepID=A0A5B8U1K5_9ACTN|nr:hypothetical protein [Baekduia soli]QEC46866.1 hypothetical protein FSW04_04185 [Baekduia soli]